MLIYGQYFPVDLQLHCHYSICKRQPNAQSCLPFPYIYLLSSIVQAKGHLKVTIIYLLVDNLMKKYHSNDE